MATDKNLAHIYQSDNEDLRILVDYLTKDKNGDIRFSEELTGTEKYKLYYPSNLNEMVDEIIDELQLYGGNTFANILRGGKGIYYREILVDVAKKMKVNFNSKSSVEVIEMNLLQKVFIDALENMTYNDLKEVMRSMDIKTESIGKQAMIAAIQAAIRAGGFASYKIAVIVANAIAKALLGKGLSLAANAAITKYLSIFAGPIGWAVTVIWTAIDIAGPAYRVTIPAVIQIAYMRAKYNYSLAG